MTGPDRQLLEVRLAQKDLVGILALPVGSVSEFEFTYDPAWLENGYPVSPHLPFNEDIPPRNVRNFLENLIPEGKGLDELLENTTIARANVFALVGRIGTETAGALSFTAPGFQQEASSFRVITDEEMGQRLQNAGLITYWDGRTRLSVAGVQDKLNILEIGDQFGLGEGELCSNTIYKFESGRVPNIVVNEAFTMALARRTLDQVATTRITTFGGVRTLIVDRFDRRYLLDENRVSRRHVIDGCQATNLPSAYKYERQNGDGPDARMYRDGVSLPKLAAVQTNDQLTYHRQLVQWVVFNVLNRNFDAHGKNISFFVGRRGLQLTPFYDLVNIEALYREAEARQDAEALSAQGRDQSTPRFYAMSIGEYEAGTPGNFEDPMTAFALADFANTLGISLERMQLLTLDVINRITQALPYALKEVEEMGLTKAERAHVELCKEIVEAACAEMMEEAKQIPSMKDFL